LGYAVEGLAAESRVPREESGTEIYLSTSFGWAIANQAGKMTAISRLFCDASHSGRVYMFYQWSPEASKPLITDEQVKNELAGLPDNLP
jgi:hypothetical protein